MSKIFDFFNHLKMHNFSSQTMQKQVGDQFAKPWFIS